MTEGLKEFEKQIEAMSEIERSKYLGKLYQGIYYSLLSDKETGRSVYHHGALAGYGYFAKRLMIVEKVSGEYLFGKELYEKYRKENVEKNQKIREELAKERENIQK